MKQSSTSKLGRIVARTLEQSWRKLDPGNLELSLEEFDQVTPLLYESGAPGLGWWRIRNSRLRNTESGELLSQAHRLLTLREAIHETHIQKIFRVLRSGGVDPILIKGWAIARLYPEPALRPYGDIDLLIRPGDYRIASETIASEAPDCHVDFHAPAFELADRPLDDVYSRSQLISCGSEQVRVLSHEDHFALLAVHLLKHGAWRPLWLCDLGLLVESEDFDWNVCLGKNRQRTNWIITAAGLAQNLLDASIRDRQIDARARNLPDWLVQTVLKQWETPFANAQPPITYRAPITSYLHSPRGLFRDLIRRWPNPIYATVSVNGTFSSRPRVRYQISDCLKRLGRTFGRAAEVRAE